MQAMSDVFAMAVVNWAATTGRRTQPLDWKFGAQLYPSKCSRGDSNSAAGMWVRNMKDPAADGVSFNCWDARFAQTDHHGEPLVDVFSAAGPGYRAFWLVARGLTCSGAPLASLGIEAAARVHFRALTAYLNTYSTYQSLRQALRLAALDLYGEEAAQVVSMAYDVVGVPRADGTVPACDARFATACS